MAETKLGVRCTTCGDTGVKGGNDGDYIEGEGIRDCPDCDQGQKNRMVRGRQLASTASPKTQ